MRMPIRAGLGAVAVTVSLVSVAAAAGAQPTADAAIRDATFRDAVLPGLVTSSRAGAPADLPASGFSTADQHAVDPAAAAEAVAGPIDLVRVPIPSPPTWMPATTSAPGPATVEIPSPTAAPSPGRGDWHHDAEVSWYGPGFYGHRTACGRALTQTLVGVANRTLPCGTVVVFRYGDRLVSAPVVDRGPYVSGRQWDLTAGLAIRLGHLFTGPLEWRLA